ncbi:hypothetical protein CTI12_AA473060 [Artemisia annua]|uniref:Uncharacterized protein n=1 Tax=Artemisia annua TaxID=35608 RepID=A0A2U1LGN2_ARTAN|nr:hypothetical protein CTI12_AA473060 [Artemisia annua]
MTKITDFEANLEQYKIYQAAINSEAAKQRALLQATIEKNKVDADQQLAEIMNAIKTLQPAATAAATIPPPHHTQPLPYSYHTMLLQQPYTTITNVMEKSGEYSGDVLIAEVEDKIQNFGYNEKSDMNESTRSNMEGIKKTRDAVIAAYDKHQGLNREQKLVNRDSNVGYARLGDTFGGVNINRLLETTVAHISFISNSKSEMVPRVISMFQTVCHSLVFREVGCKWQFWIGTMVPVAKSRKCRDAIHVGESSY